MEPYSYFLPIKFLKNKETISADDDKMKTVRKYSSVYSHRINEYIDQKKITGYGRTITFGKRDDSTFTFSSYQISNNEFIQSQTRKFSVHTDFDHSLYCCSNEICFMFKLRKNNGVARTKIDVSCIRFDESGSSVLQENIAVLQYNHVFNQYSCSLSDVERKLVIITGRDLDSYGTKLEMVDNYMDILSYTFDDGSSNIVTKHEVRKNLTEACKLYDIDRIFFSLCGTKLFFVFGKVFVVYSTSLDLFGDIFELSDSEQYHMTRYCFYVHNKYTGNLLIMCQSDGFIYTIREKNLVLELLNERNLYLSNFGFNDEIYVFLHVDSFDDVTVYFTIGYELYILDYLQQSIVGKYIPTKQHYIVDVKTNWSGEEVFVFHGIANTRQQQLNVLYISKRNSLKDIAKLKVLQTYSRRQLKHFHLPLNLKVEMKVL